jgi:hypothetical protein
MGKDSKKKNAKPASAAVAADKRKEMDGLMRRYLFYILYISIPFLASRYINKQRTLIFSTRGITHRDRHLIQDLRDLLPHGKKDNKLDVKGLLVFSFHFDASCS